MLLSVPGKILNRVMLQRMKNAVDTKLSDNQAGFRQNRSCADQIATIRIILNGHQNSIPPSTQFSLIFKKHLTVFFFFSFFFLEKHFIEYSYCPILI